NRLLAYTNYDAPNGSVVSIDIENPQKWLTVVNQYNDAVLLKTILLHDSSYLCVHRHRTMTDIISKISPKGELINSSPVTSGLTINSLSKLDDSNVLVNVGFPVLPPIVYNLNTDNMKLTTFKSTEITYR